MTDNDFLLNRFNGFEKEAAMMNFIDYRMAMMPKNTAVAKNR